MPPFDLHSVQQSNIWAEVIKKEDIARLLWYDRTNIKSLQGKSLRYEVRKKQIESNSIKPVNTSKLPPLDTKKHVRKSYLYYQRATESRHVQQAIEALSKRCDDEIIEMYPADKKVRQLLYDGISKEEKGRHKYLKTRKRIIPELRYPFPLCSSWEYGWHIEDHIPRHSVKKPEYGRTCRVESEFFTRNQIPLYHKDRHLKEDDARAYILMAD